MNRVEDGALGSPIGSNSSGLHAGRNPRPVLHQESGSIFSIGCMGSSISSAAVCMLIFIVFFQ